MEQTTTAAFAPEVGQKFTTRGYHFTITEIRDGLVFYSLNNCRIGRPLAWFIANVNSTKFAPIKD